MIYAVYRILYGHDFIRESVQSIQDHVDRIFIFWSDRPWGGVREVEYLGEKIELPFEERKPFDGWMDKLKSLELGTKVTCKYDHVYGPVNQFTHLINKYVLRREQEVPETIIIMEPDHVIGEDQLEYALREFRGNGYRVAHTRQVELWRTPTWRIPERPNRTGTVFWDLKGIPHGRLPDTKHQGEPRSADFMRLDAITHNMGFCNSYETMLLKHLCALGFSKTIKDSEPNESWLEKKWKTWDPETNNENLEIAKGFEEHIPKAVPYDTDKLPAPLKIRYRL